MVPSKLTKKLAEAEISAARSYLDRHDIDLTWEGEDLELHIKLIQPKTQDDFYLIGSLQDYKELPPKWFFSDSNWDSKIVKSNFPNKVNTPFGSSIFHKNGVICAPFNRLAYKQYSGPHGDWGAPSQWINVKGNFVKAFTLAEMISVIYRDFKFTTGRMR